MTDPRIAELIARERSLKAAAARVPELEAEIERLRGQRDACEEQLQAAYDAYGAELQVSTDLRTRLDAAPGLTELRERYDSAVFHNDAEHARALVEAVGRLLAAVPSTGTDGGAA